MNKTNLWDFSLPVDHSVWQTHVEIERQNVDKLSGVSQGCADIIGGVVLHKVRVGVHRDGVFVLRD